MNILRSKKVSVIIPNYNYARYLKTRIKSVLTQSYPIYELIILDDASTDGSSEIIERLVLDYKTKYPKLNIFFVINKENSGKPMLQWKKGFELAKGDYIWIAEADDLSNKNFLNEVMKGFDDEDVVLSYTESRVINSRGMLLVPNMRWSRDKEKTGHYKRNYEKDGLDEIREIMAIRCSIPNVSAVVFKNNRKMLKFLDEAARFTQVGDWYFYTKILETGKLAYNRKPLNYFRVHGGSATKKSANNGIHYKEVLELHGLFMKRYDLDQITIERMMAEQNRVRKKHDIIDDDGEKGES